MDDTLHFTLLLLNERHKRLAKEVYEEFPKKVKNRINKRAICVTDLYDKSVDPGRKIDGERMGFYIRGTRFIYITFKSNEVYSDIWFRGLIAHETAHTYDYFSPTFQKGIRKIFYKIKYYFLKNSLFNLYSHSNFPVDELIADSLAKSWGFEKEINALYNE